MLDYLSPFALAASFLLAGGMLHKAIEDSPSYGFGFILFMILGCLAGMRHDSLLLR